jgi:arginase family enzyme
MALDKKIRLLDFDGSVTAQKRLLSRYDSEILDLTDIGPKVRFWAVRSARDAAARRIPDGEKNHISFLGSGDFHHMTEILLARHVDPVALIHFDFHQDWDSTCPLLHCGSWITKALKRNSIVKCVTLGASAKKMSFFSLQAGDLRLLENDRLELYPYASEPGTVFMRTVPRNRSCRIKRYPLMTRIAWTELKTRNLSEFAARLIERLPTQKVYVTLDKDCMNAGSALTNWDQGEMTVDHVCAVLKVIRERCDIVGMDITGDYSPVTADSAFKHVMLRWAHPKTIAASGYSPSAITAVNERTNLRIVETMLR